MLNKSKILILFFIIGRFAIAQSGFNNYYPSGYLSTGNKIIEIESGKYMVTSYYKDSTTQEQGLDFKHIDDNGNVLLRKRYIFSNLDFGSFNNTGFQEDISSRNVLLTGSTFIGTNSAVAFLSVDKTTLDTNWVRSYSNSAYGYNLNTILKVKDNEFWMFGSRSLNASYGTRPYAIKIDTLGAIVGFKEFNTLVKFLPKASCYDINTNKIYCTGRNVNNPSDFNTFILCMDTTGNVCWNSQFTSTTYDPYFNKIEKKNDYLILCGLQGEFSYGGFEQGKLNLIKVNALNGSIVWNKKYFDAFYTNYLPSFVINNDESIVSSGSAGFFNPVVDYNNDGIILKVNSSGDSLWMQSFGNYGQGTMEIFYDLTKTSDGGYLLCGLSNNTLTLHTWLVKTDSLGYGPGRTTNIENATLNRYNFSFFPNPAKDYLNITLKNNQISSSGIIKIFNNIGQLVKEYIFNDSLSNSIQINISDLQNGVYLLQAKSVAGTYQNKIIIQK